MPPKTTNPTTFSSENHTMLVQLTDSVNNLGKQVSQSYEAQQAENKNLHARIDSVQVETRKGVDEIKSSLAQTGKISASNIFALIAVIVSVLALGGGIATAYIDVRLGNITPLIEANAAHTDDLRTEMRSQREDLTRARLEAARMDEARRWMEKIIESASTR